jgi:hypothetical protein
VVAAVLVIGSSFMGLSPSSASTGVLSSSNATSKQQSVASKYKYFKNNRVVVVKALLQTKCRPNGFSFEVLDGPTIWVRQTKKFKTNVGTAFPLIEYRPAASSSAPFKLRSGGESKAWWQQKWGCPLTEAVGGTYWGVSMTTQQLISAGY